MKFNTSAHQYNKSNKKCHRQQYQNVIPHRSKEETPQRIHLENLIINEFDVAVDIFDVFLVAASGYGGCSAVAFIHLDVYFARSEGNVSLFIFIVIAQGDGFQFEIALGIASIVLMFATMGMFMYIAHDAQRRWGGVTDTRYRDTLDAVEKQEWFERQQRLQEYQEFLEQRRREAEQNESSR